MTRHPYAGAFRRVARVAVAAMPATWALLGVAAAPSASAQPCSDVEVTFARGTGESPGLGPTGDAFVNALRPKLGAKSLNVYAVNYPATEDWPTGMEGIRDASNHVESVAANCPKSKNVLGGFSQGAAVMGFVTSDSIPDGVAGPDVPQPMPPEVADHVSSVVLFGLPNERAMNFLGQPPVSIGPAYQAKTIELCADNDPICSDGMEFAAHDSYANSPLIEQGATFAANHL